MLEQANAKDNAAIAELDAATEALAGQERSCATLRSEARDSRDRLAIEQAELDEQLQGAQQARSPRSRSGSVARRRPGRSSERALLAAQKAASQQSTSGKDYTGAYVATGLVCPVPGASFIDSWGFPRATTGRHQGVDLMAPRGTPEPWRSCRATCG